MTMAALKGAETPSLSIILSPEVAQSFDAAAELLKDVGPLGPSLAAMEDILHQAVARWHRTMCR